MENNANTILDGLDAVQREAAACTEGPVLIVAGAGAGKTRVLTSRIAYILAKGTEPSRVLALTFTKKAAAEMKERIARMVGENRARRLYMGTFHSVFIRFLRDYSQEIGYPQNFTIYDTSDSLSAIKHCLKQLQLDDKVYKPKDVLSRISDAKNNLITPEAYAANSEARTNDRHQRRPELHKVYAAYQQVMRQAGVMDFDDILLNMNLLLYKFQDARKELASRFSYILVDEYQDTNFSQYVILRTLSMLHRNICVVGDDSQSIYAFRGARIENILNFRKDYPESKIFRLEQNYRSTQNIVAAANSLIAKNENRIPKNCYSNGSKGERIRLSQAYTAEEEALLIASSIITRMRADKSQYQDFAILYRTNAQSRALEEALRKRNLPYMIYSGNSFFDRAEVKDMMAYLKLAVNPNDDEAFRRIVNTPARGIGNTSLESLSVAARAHGWPLMKTIYADDLENYGLKGAAIAKLRNFGEMMSKAHSQVPTLDAFKLAASISDACGLHASFKMDNSIEAQSRAANIEELINSVKSFVESRQNDYIEEMQAEGSISDASEVDEAMLPPVTLDAFLEDISLLSAVDMAEDEDGNNKIALMTVHSSKGLEFPHVYIAGMEENIFPSGGDTISPSELEEERRLFYVALTRAEKTVDISFAATRMRNGRHESNSPSRFIREISKEFIANPLDEAVKSPFGSTHGGFENPFAGERKFGGNFGGNYSHGRYGAKDSGDERFSGNKSPFGGESRPTEGPKPSFKPACRVAPKPSAMPSGRIPSKPAPKPIPGDDFDIIPALSLKAGQRIEHNRFGLGTIVSINNSPSSLMAVIDFDNFGQKTVALKFAKMRIPK